MADDVKDMSTRGSLVAIAIAMIVIAILIGMIAFRGTGGVSQFPKKDQYQAVFLTNGQVYFGKLKGLGGAYVKLQDVYYIQSQNPQQGAQSTPQPSPGTNLSLVKLGNEIHGPDAEMQIGSDQILFWENLKNDSKVVEAIKNKGSDNKDQNKKDENK